MQDSETNTAVEDFVPSKKAYLIAWLSLFVSGITGGFIGYALMTVFAPDISQMGQNIGCIVIAAAIVYGMSVVTTLGLQASVEWKARALITKNSQRPSRLLK